MWAEYPTNETGVSVRLRWHRGWRCDGAQEPDSQLNPEFREHPRLSETDLGPERRYLDFDDANSPPARNFRRGEERWTFCIRGVQASTCTKTSWWPVLGSRSQ